LADIECTNMHGMRNIKFILAFHIWYYITSADGIFFSTINLHIR